jgi:hypothetical protein
MIFYTTVVILHSLELLDVASCAASADGSSITNDSNSTSTSSKVSAPSAKEPDEKWGDYE